MFDLNKNLSVYCSLTNYCKYEKCKIFPRPIRPLHRQVGRYRGDIVKSLTISSKKVSEI